MIRTHRSKDAFGPGRLRAWESAQDGKVLLLRFDAACAEVGIDAYGTVRIRATGGSEVGPDPAGAVVRDPLGLVRLRITEDERGIVVEPRGRSPKGAGVWAKPRVIVDSERPIIEARRGPLGRRGSGGFSPRLWAVELMEFSSGGAARAAIVTDISARYWGFGEKTGPLDKRGLGYTMRCRDAPVRAHLDPVYASIPFFMWSRPAWKAAASASSPKSSGGQDLAYATSGCMLECFAPSHFDIARSFDDRVIVTTEGWGVDLTMFAGPTPKDVLRRYCARTGLAPMPPLWALGYHQSRWSYETQDKVIEVAREFAEREIPLDVVHLDIDYMDGYRVFTWDKDRFPDPEGMIERLRRMGVRIVTIVDPGVKVERGFDVFDEGVRRGVFCRRDDGALYRMWVWPRDAAFCDFNREEARRFWGELHERLFDVGVSGIWNDMNEPAGWRFDLRVSKLILPLLPQDTSRMRQADPTNPSGREIAHESVRNIYGYQQCRGLIEHLRGIRPDERPFLLTRSGYAGIQRFAAMWTGDIASTWRHLDLSVRMLLGLSLSGVGFCGADIGGFVGRPSGELFARWIQLGSLYPFSRTHTQGIWGWQEPYSFGAEVESISKEYISMRMRLLAYIYGLFAEYSREGIPPWRTVFVEYPESSQAYLIDDEVMLGSDILLAPITSKGSRSRRVFFPPGEWIPLACDLSPWEGRAHTGPVVSTIDASVSRMPVFVRAGAVLPSLWPARSTAEITGEIPRSVPGTGRPLTFKAFCHSPGYLASRTTGGVSKGTSSYYEDDFGSNGYRDGEYALYGIELEERLEADDRILVRLSAGLRQGSYSPRLEPVSWELWCPPDLEPVSATLDGREVDWEWNGRLGVVTFGQSGPVEPVEIEVVLSARRVR